MTKEQIGYIIEKKYQDYITKEDIIACIDSAYEKCKKRKRCTIEISVKDDYVGYEILADPVMRIRRITGYLTGSLNTWNNAKQAEVKERVKHI
mgnify:CR=1 FL=1